MSEHQYRPTISSALIIAPDPLAGALVGGAVELAGFRPLFARSVESAGQAFRRLRPTCVLLDCDDPAVRNDALLGHAIMTGTQIFLFGAAHRARDLEGVAARFQLVLIVFPRDVERLADILRRGIESSRHPRESTAR